MENNEIQAQGILDVFKLLDPEVIDKIDRLVRAIDVDKIQQIMDAIEVTEDRIEVKLGLTIKR